MSRITRRSILSNRTSELSESAKLAVETEENTTPRRRRVRPKQEDPLVEKENECSPRKQTKSVRGPDCETISVKAVGCLPERERETEELATYIEDVLAENGSGSLYISGPPGTGKTATLTKIISDRNLACKIKMVYVNCTSMSSAGSIYRRICEELQLHAAGGTEKHYLSAIEEHLKKKHKTIMLVLDEIDQLATSKQTVLYNIFEWPAKRNSKLILVGVANALDLTDRLLSRLQARCELRPHLIQFLPYTKPQLVNILKSSLENNDSSELFNEAALTLLAAKVASTSGDARRALLLAKSLVESTDKEHRQIRKAAAKANPAETPTKPASPPKVVQIKQVINTLNHVYGSTQNMDDDAAFPLQQKLLICSLLLILKVSKSKDVTVGKLHQVYKTVCSKQNLHSVDQTEFLNLCSLVETRGVLRLQGKKEPRLNRVLLQWDEDEIHNVLNDKQLIASILSDTTCVGK
ncbi:cell division control protein 6 homolog [Sabethes cyaneus]|uniref:cell division control protein 6 homolog n=1 Tax=Sabethes cyaneus TaxID=53552 RepID=UPI00237E49E8|nr:cell division control protein 6 homolog [Sabethes cyaneus]